MKYLRDKLILQLVHRRALPLCATLQKWVRGSARPSETWIQRGHARWIPACSTEKQQHQNMSTGGRVRRRRCNIFRLFPLLCISCRLLQRRAESERTPLNLWEKGLVSHSIGISFRYVQDPNGTHHKYTSFVSTVTAVNWYKSIQHAALANSSYLLLWQNSYTMTLCVGVCVWVCRRDLKISAHALCRVVSFATDPAGLDSICPLIELTPPKWRLSLQHAGALFPLWWI